ncbi:MAG: hypothetical protein FJ197_09380 [Gammaproteobacteria bacterium]|nr:hypothetical protein [Gammaproteobacteria bacterium]
MRNRLYAIAALAGFVAATLAVPGTAAGTTAVEGYAEVSVRQADEAGSRLTDRVPFRLDIALRCPAGTTTTELFASIADSARAEALASGTSGVSWLIEVPRAQLAWLDPLTRTCAAAAAQRQPDERDAGGANWYRMRSGTQAYVTLTCAGDSGTAARHADSTPLTLWFSCP